jgi:hypothetical protein
MLNNKLNCFCNLFRIKRINANSALSPFDNLFPKRKIGCDNRNPSEYRNRLF